MNEFSPLFCNILQVSSLQNYLRKCEDFYFVLDKISIFTFTKNTFEQRYLDMIAHYKLALALANRKPGLLTLLNIRRGADQAEVLI